MRRHNTWWTFGQIILDLVLINLAIVIAWYLRYVLLCVLPFGEGFYYADYTAYIPFAILYTVLAIVIFRL